ncbi:hypothetical protein FHETE_6899 [Fusarium heterosporum]|uniref:Uncharacterized protein n=1 Tax=Fusarium heterosporum TaxID=42747 RepID=A0A8H5T597_FUSHE|nr:hypothetical protein FHETE_6899 [Fusarium heterosporum]
MKTGFVAFVLAAAAPLAMAAPFHHFPGGFWSPPINGTQPGDGQAPGGPGGWLPLPPPAGGPGGPGGAIPTPPPVVPRPTPVPGFTPPPVPQVPPPAPTEPVVVPTPTPFARK